MGNVAELQPETVRKIPQHYHNQLSFGVMDPNFVQPLSKECILQGDQMFQVSDLVGDK